MITLRFDQLVNMTGGTLLNAECGGRLFTGVSIDSRTIMPGELFIAIRGEQHDGHNYIDQVVARGAAGIVSERRGISLGYLPANLAVVEVADSHRAMLRLAAEYLRTVKARRIGITGSNGKTTTKEFTYQLLSTMQDEVYRSPGNYNNLFGIPLALLAMPRSTQVAVLEIGISVPGEMAGLADIIRPAVIAITNISPTHLEFLGSVETVVREKLDLVRGASSEVPVIVNADDYLLVRETSRLRPDYLSFGIDNEADFRPNLIRHDEENSTVVEIEGHSFCVPLFGRHQVYNLLAAYAIVRTMGYSFDDVDTMSIRLSTSPMRGEMVKARGVTFVADCYNANPDSVKAGLESFAAYGRSARRIVILGDMLELGQDAPEYHRDIGKQLALQSSDLAVLVGPLSRHTKEAAREAGMAEDKLLHFETAKACAEQLDEYLLPGDVVYLKGSRGIGLEIIIARRQGSEEES